MTVRVVLDVSALLGYADVDRALAVGELVRLVREDGIADHVAIPASAFVTAHARADEHGRSLLAGLVTDVQLALARQDPTQSAFTILPLDTDDLLAVSQTETAWPGQGHAVVEAIRHDALLATFGPAPDAEGLTVIDLGAGWDDDPDPGWSDPTAD
jgi:hypothetical protein